MRQGNHSLRSFKEKEPIMGNRAIVTIEDKEEYTHPIALYLHWNGGLESVLAFIEYTNTLFTNTNSIYDYHTRLCQVLRNFFPDGYCIYAHPQENAKDFTCDNGHFHFRIQSRVALISHNGIRDRDYLADLIKQARNHEYWKSDHTIFDSIKENMPKGTK